MSSPTISSCSHWHSLLFSSCVWSFFPLGLLGHGAASLVQSQCVILQERTSGLIRLLSRQATGPGSGQLNKSGHVLPSRTALVLVSFCSVDEEQPITLPGTCLCVPKIWWDDPMEDPGSFSMKIGPHSGHWGVLIMKTVLTL